MFGKKAPVPTNFNFELANRVLDFVETHPDLHRQRVPAECIVGWTLRLAEGRGFVFPSPNGAAEALGISYDEALVIWDTTSEEDARNKLRDIIAREETRARAMEPRPSKREARRAMKRAQRAEAERQAALDAEARRQVKEAAQAINNKKEKVLV